MLDDLLLNKLAAVEQRYEELSGKLGDPAILANRQQFQKMSKEHADLRDLVESFRVHRELSKPGDPRSDRQGRPVAVTAGHNHASGAT